jgi:UDP-GlcNAc3NAcA epimerase
MKKIFTVVGARPQFIKAAAVSRAIRTHFSDQLSEKIIHTGQHFDANMSDVFFEELDIPKPHRNLEIAGGGHGQMTGRMLEGIETLLIEERPDWVLIYGDTNSTLAGALAAAKLHIPIAHVEAGLRSYNMGMPEEVNRILSDRISELLFCPTQTAVDNLASEGLTKGVHLPGDVMFDVALYYKDKAARESTALSDLGLTPKGFVLATCHRAENTDYPARRTSILGALGRISKSHPVVLPLHPRTRAFVGKLGLEALLEDLITVDPLSFTDMLALEQASAVIVTDSGGVQKEAFFYDVPCITMRDETEWVETVNLGWNRIVGADAERIVTAFEEMVKTSLERPQVSPYGSGDAAEQIAAKLV